MLVLLNVDDFESVGPWLGEHSHVIVSGWASERYLVVHTGDNLLLHGDDSAELDVLLLGEGAPGLLLDLFELLGGHELLKGLLIEGVVSADLSYKLCYPLAEPEDEEDGEEEEEFCHSVV